jgi:hypothetical protein
MNINFVTEIVQKIYKWIQYLELKNILLLIRALGNYLFYYLKLNF